MTSPEDRTSTVVGFPHKSLFRLHACPRVSSLSLSLSLSHTHTLSLSLSFSLSLSLSIYLSIYPYIYLSLTHPLPISASLRARVLACRWMSYITSFDERQALQRPYNQKRPAFI